MNLWNGVKSLKRELCLITKGGKDLLYWKAAVCFKNLFLSFLEEGVFHMPENFNCSSVPSINFIDIYRKGLNSWNKITAVLLNFFPKYFNESDLFFSVKDFTIMRENSVAGKI